MKGKYRLLIIPKGTQSVGSSRYRAYSLGKKLDNLGWQVWYSSPSYLPNLNRAHKSILYIRDIFRVITHYPRVVLAQSPYHTRFHLLLLMLCKFLGASIVYDIDDAADENYPAVPWLLNNSSVIFTASQHLQAWASKRNNHIILIPTSVDFNIYSPSLLLRNEDPGNKTVLGWIGNAISYHKGLEQIALVLKNLPEPIKNQVCFRCIGTKGNKEIESLFSEAQIGVQMEMVPEIEWSDERIVAMAISKFDVGLAPWRGYESGATFKTIQYMAAGKIAVAESAGENTNYIINEKTGFLVSHNNTTEWVNCLTRVVKMSFLERKAMGDLARQEVIKIYSIDIQAVKIDAILKELACE